MLSDKRAAEGSWFRVQLYGPAEKKGGHPHHLQGFQQRNAGAAELREYDLLILQHELYMLAKRFDCASYAWPT